MKERLKLSVRDTKYYINPAKETVTCVMKFTMDGPTDTMRAIDDYIWATNESFDTTVTVTAKVRSGDVFNEEVGVKIARTKAESAMYRRVGRLMYRVAEHYSGVFKNVYDFAQKSSGVIIHNDKYLQKF